MRSAGIFRVAVAGLAAWLMAASSPVQAQALDKV